MKTEFFRKSRLWIAVAGSLALFSESASAQLTVAGPATQTTDTQNVEVTLSPGVPDILKLSAARVGDDAIVAYVANSGTSFNLSVNEIVYLKKQGVSDRVLAAMLNQAKRTSDTTVQPSPAPVATPAVQPAQAVPTSQSVYANAPGTQFAPAVSQQTAYAQTPTASTVYVVPSTTTYAYSSYPAYYSSYPAYYGGCGYSYPGVSLGIGLGLGGGWCGTGWYGGGGYYGGGWGSGCWGGYRGGYGGYGGIGIGVGVGFGGGWGWRGGGYCRR